jgi:hypothetical protein
VRAGTSPCPIRSRARTLLASAALAAVGCLCAAVPALAAGDSPLVEKKVRAHGRTLTLKTHIDTHPELDRAGRELTAARARQLLAGSDQPGTAAFYAPALGADYLSDTWCGTERDTDDVTDAVHPIAPLIKVVYAYPSDQASRFNTYKNVMQAQVKSISNLVAASSGQAKSLRFDLGTSCGSAYVDIQSVQLSNDLAYYQAHDINTRFDAILADVHAAVPATSQRRNYLIYADYMGGGGFPAAGQGELWDDDSPGAGNFANNGELNAVAYGSGAAYFSSSNQATGNIVPLHEITHMLGGVQDSAPHSTLAGHCFDEYDVECYADGGTHGQPGDMTYTCGSSSNQLYDCGGDDYFNPNPAGGSYLATKWNTYNNVFLCALATCGTGAAADTTPPDTAITSGPPPFTNVTDATFSFSSSEPGSTFQCQIDIYAWFTCVPPWWYPGFTYGAHTFRVRAVDPASNVDPSPASATWTVAAPTSPGPTTATTASNPTGLLTASGLARALRLPAAGSTVRVIYRGRKAFVPLGRATCSPVCWASATLNAVRVPRSLRMGRTVSFGRRVVHLSAGGSVAFEVTVTPAGRKLLKRRRTVNASVTIAGRDRLGLLVSLQRKLVLRR